MGQDEPGAEAVEQLAEEEALQRMRQFERMRPQMFEVGDVLAALALEDLFQARRVYGTKSGTELGPQVVAAGRRKQLTPLEEQKAIILMPRLETETTALWGLLR